MFLSYPEASPPAERFPVQGYKVQLPAPPGPVTSSASVTPRLDGSGGKASTNTNFLYELQPPIPVVTDKTQGPVYYDRPMGHKKSISFVDSEAEAPHSNTSCLKPEQVPLPESDAEPNPGNQFESSPENDQDDDGTNDDSHSSSLHKVNRSVFRPRMSHASHPLPASDTPRPQDLGKVIIEPNHFSSNNFSPSRVTIIDRAREDLQDLLRDYTQSLQEWNDRNAQFITDIQNLERTLSSGLRSPSLHAADLHPSNEEERFPAADVRPLATFGSFEPYSNQAYGPRHAVEVWPPDDWQPAWTIFPLKVFRGCDHCVLQIEHHWKDDQLLRELRKVYDKLRTPWRKWFSLKSVRCGR